MMELKNAAAVCLISLVSATLVVLIARSLDSQAAAQLEPRLDRIANELGAIRKAVKAGGGAATEATDVSADSGATIDNGLVVYYFHSKTRCPTCQSIESQAHEAIQTEFAARLDSGEMAWKTLNYEEPSNAKLAERFEVQTPVVVLARMKDGQIADWRSLDKVWALVGDKPAFRDYVRGEIARMLAAGPPATSPSGDAPAIPVPDVESTNPDSIPLPE